MQSQQPQRSLPLPRQFAASAVPLSGAAVKERVALSSGAPVATVRERRRLSPSFKLHLLFTARVTAVLLVASVVVHIPALQAWLGPKFLTVAIAAFSVRETTGATLSALFNAAPLSVTLGVSTLVAYGLPTVDSFPGGGGALIIVLKFLLAGIGATALQWSSYDGLVKKLCAVLYLLPLYTSTLDPQDVAGESLRLLISIFVAEACAAVAILVPWPTSTRHVVDSRLNSCCRALSELFDTLGRDFAPAGEALHQPLKHASHHHLRANRVPTSIRSDPTFARFHSGDGWGDSIGKSERAAVLFRHIDENLAKCRALMGSVQWEYPFHSLAGYHELLDDLSVKLSRLQAAFLALENLHQEDSVIARFRGRLRDDQRALCQKVSTWLLALARTDSDLDTANARADIEAMLEHYRHSFFLHRKAMVRNVSKEYGSVEEWPRAYRADLIATFFMTHQLVRCAIEATRFKDTSLRVPSYEPMKTSLLWYAYAWAPVSKSSSGIISYVASGVFKQRLLTSLLFGLSVVLASMFVFVPEIRAAIGGGTTAVFTIVFVFNDRAGTSLKAGKDRLMGMFIGLSSAYFAFQLIDLNGAFFYQATLTTAAMMLAGAVVILLIGQDSPGISNAALFALMLVLFAAEEENAEQVLVQNVLMSFVGVGVLTLTTAPLWLSTSARVQAWSAMVGAARDMQQAVDGCIARWVVRDEDAGESEEEAGILSRTSSTSSMEGMEPEQLARYVEAATQMSEDGHELRGLVQSARSNVAAAHGAVQSAMEEPQLWRPRVRIEKVSKVEHLMRQLAHELEWLERATRLILLHQQDMQESGLMRCSAVAAFVGTKESLLDAMGGIVHMLKVMEKPEKKIVMMERSTRLGGAVDIPIGLWLEKELAQNIQTLMNERKRAGKDGLLSNVPVVALFSTLFLLQRSMVTTSQLWTAVVDLVTDYRFHYSRIH